eukprot:Rmarinus@m.5773
MSIHIFSENPDRCAPVVSNVLLAMVDENAPAMTAAQLAKFRMENDPRDLPLMYFVESLLEICTTSEVVCGLLYVRRLLKAPLSLERIEPYSALTRYNVHRIMFTAVVLANLQWSDIPYSTQSWAKWSSVWTSSSVVTMKILFLKGIDWRLHIRTSDFETIVSQLESMACPTEHGDLHR